VRVFLQKLGDMFLDQGGGVDEKRVLGTALVVQGCVYLWTHSPGNNTWITVAGLLTFGFAALGIASAADQGKLGGP
jgi:hypothetical protein